MKDNLNRSLEWSRSAEGGFSVRPDEPGGAVQKGVSFLVFQEWRKKQGQPAPTLGDLKALTDEEAIELYTEMYAKPMRFDELPLGLDFCLLDISIMEGTRGAKLLLQLALDLPWPPSGKYDEPTLNAVAKCDVEKTIRLLGTLHYTKKFYSGNWQLYTGWGPRIRRRTAKAIEMIE